MADRVSELIDVKIHKNNRRIGDAYINECNDENKQLGLFLGVGLVIIGLSMYFTQKPKHHEPIPKINWNALQISEENLDVLLKNQEENCKALNISNPSLPSDDNVKK